MSYINNGVIKNGSKIGTATVDSSGLLKKGWMIPYVSFTPSSVTIHETDMPNVSSEQIYKSLKMAIVIQVENKHLFRFAYLQQK